MLKMSLSTFDERFVDAVEAELNRPETKEQVQKDRKFGYVPFEGHQSRLGHYYRHLSSPDTLNGRNRRPLLLAPRDTPC
jgi:hypothetical protein